MAISIKAKDKFILDCSALGVNKLPNYDSYLDKNMAGHYTRNQLVRHIKLLATYRSSANICNNNQRKQIIPLGLRTKQLMQ